MVLDEKERPLRWLCDHQLFNAFHRFVLISTFPSGPCTEREEASRIEVPIQVSFRWDLPDRLP